MDTVLSNFFQRAAENSLFLLGFQGIGKLIGIHLVANSPRLRFTFRYDLARVINLICICIVPCLQVLQSFLLHPFYSGLDTWKGWRRKDYQMQLYMDM